MPRKARVKNLQDHLRYYKTYGGINPSRRRAAAASPEATAQVEQQAKKIQAIEARLARVNRPTVIVPKQAPEPFKSDQSAKRLRTLEARLRVLEQEKEQRNGANPGNTAK